jgi:hypothetical protein
VTRKRLPCSIGSRGLLVSFYRRSIAAFCIVNDVRAIELVWRAMGSSLSPKSTGSVLAPSLQVKLIERPSLLSRQAICPGFSTRRTRAAGSGCNRSGSLFSRRRRVFVIAKSAAFGATADSCRRSLRRE